MTTEALVEAKLNKGRTEVAEKLGKTYSAYRPTIAGDPFTTLYAYLTLYLKPFNKQVYESVQIFQILGDTTALQRGDYLVFGAETYFVGTFKNLKQPLAFRCNDKATYYSGTGNVGSSVKWPCCSFYSSVIGGRSWLFPFSPLNIYPTWDDYFFTGTLYTPSSTLTITGGTILDDAYLLQTA